MKKLIIVSLSIVLLSTTLVAQETRTGIKGGLNLTSLSTDENNDNNLKTGFHLGVFTKIPVSESFAIQPELMYSMKGIKMKYNESALADGDTKFNLNYIDLPVKLVFNLSEDFEFQVGPYVSYLVNANVDTDAEVLDFWDIDSNEELDREHFHSLDYGISAGLGFDLDPLVMGLNYNLGLQPVAKDDDVSNDILGAAKNSVIQLYVGMKF